MIHSARGIGKYMNEKSRTLYANSHLLSRIQYGLPSYLGEKVEIKSKVHTSIMKVSRWCKASYCFKISCKKINNSLNWDTPEQMIVKSSLLFYHKIMSKGQPSHLTSYIRMPRTRASAKPALHYKNKSSEFDRTFLKKGLILYNSIPDELKKLPHKIFKTRIKKIYFMPPSRNKYMRGRAVA